MTVAELIEKLQSVPNKSIDVLISYHRDEDADEAQSTRIEAWPDDEDVFLISDSAQKSDKGVDSK